MDTQLLQLYSVQVSMVTLLLYIYIYCTPFYGYMAVPHKHILHGSIETSLLENKYRFTSFQRFGTATLDWIDYSPPHTYLSFTNTYFRPYSLVGRGERQCVHRRVAPPHGTEIDKVGVERLMLSMTRGEDMSGEQMDASSLIVLRYRLHLFLQIPAY